MNLLILYAKNKDEIFNRKSAIGSYINCLASLLSDTEITVFLNGKLFQRETQTTITTYNVSRGKSDFIKTLIPGLIKRIIKERNHFKLIDSLANEIFLNDTKFDAILEFYTVGSNVGLSVSQQLEIPLFITYDSPILEEYRFFNGVEPFFKRKICNRELNSLLQAKAITVYSNSMKNFIKQKTNQDSVIRIHQNIDFTRFDFLDAKKNFKDKPINLCFIGSFLKWHQVDLLVMVFAELVLKYNIFLYLVGDGMEREQVMNLVSKMNPSVQEKIIFTGFLDGKELMTLKQKMHIGVMPGSNWYGAPNKIFEYGAMKLAVIAPDTPTICDLFTENEIQLFKWESKIDLSNKLEQLVSDPTAMSNFSITLHNKICNKYSTENTSDFYTSLLNDT